MSTNEDAVHRSSGWCSVNLFRVSRRRGARTPPLYLMYPDSIRILPGCRRVSLTVAVVLTSPYSRMCPLLMTLAAPVKVAPAAGCAHTRPRVTAQTQRAPSDPAFSSLHLQAHMSWSPGLQHTKAAPHPRRKTGTMQLLKPYANQAVTRTCPTPTSVRSPTTTPPHLRHRHAGTRRARIVGARNGRHEQAEAPRLDEGIVRWSKVRLSPSPAGNRVSGAARAAAAGRARRDGAGRHLRSHSDHRVADSEVC